MLVLMLSRVSSRVSGFPVASPCLWGKLQNLSFLILFEGVKSSSNVVLRGRLATCASFSEDEFHFSWQARHFGDLHHHFAWQARHFRRVMLRVFLQIALSGLHACLYTPHFTLYTPHFTPYTYNHTLHSTLYTLDSTLYTPHSTFYTPH